jgi:hypothetical protein
MSYEMLKLLPGVVYGAHFLTEIYTLEDILLHGFAPLEALPCM